MKITSIFLLSLLIFATYYGLNSFQANRDLISKKNIKQAEVFDLGTGMITFLSTPNTLTLIDYLNKIQDQEWIKMALFTPEILLKLTTESKAVIEIAFSPSSHQFAIKTGNQETLYNYDQFAPSIHEILKVGK